MPNIDTYTPGNHRRDSRPESIIIGNVTFVRNDVVARQQHVSERTLNRADKDGAPFKFFGGVKYRPEPQYGQWILSTIITRKRPMRRRIHQR